MKNFLSTIVLVMAFVCHHATAQNIKSETITWNSTKAINQKDNSEVVYNCSFVTHADKTIEWSQNDGKKVNTYNITATDGSWDSILTDGSVTFQVEQGIVTGELTFSRNNSQIEVRLKLKVNGKPDLDYQFQIESTQP